MNHASGIFDRVSGNMKHASEIMIHVSGIMNRVSGNMNHASGIMNHVPGIIRPKSAPQYASKSVPESEQNPAPKFLRNLL